MLSGLIRRRGANSLSRGIRVYQPNKDYGPTYHEKIRYIELYKKEITKNIALYKTKQQEIDLDYVKTFEHHEYLRMLRDATKARTNCAKDTFKEQERVKAARKIEEQRQLDIREYYIQEEINNANRKRVLKTMDIDSQNWFKLETIDEQLEKQVIVPDIVENHLDYYRKLQDTTLAYHIGDYEGVDKTIYQELITQKKNSMIVPIYKRIKGLIKYFKLDGEGKLMQEYEVARALILKNTPREDVDAQMEKLDSIYSGLVIALRKQLKEPRVMVEHLHKRFLLFYNILSLWREYTTILRMGSEEILRIMDDAGFQEAASDIDPAELAIHQSSDEDLDTSIDSDTDLVEIRKKMINDFKETTVGSKSNISYNHLKSSNSSDSEFDSDKKSADDSTLGTSDLEASDASSTLQIEDLVDWQQLDRDVNDDKLEEEYENLDSGSSKLYGAMAEYKATKVQDLLKRFEVEKIIPKELSEQIFNFSEPVLSHPTVEHIRELYIINKTTDVTQFNSGIFVEIASQIISNMDTSKFSSKDLQKHKDLVFLLERIGNVKVNEAELLSKLMDTI